MTEIIDISPTLTEGIPVWPGDTDFQQQSSWAIDEHCPVNVSRIQMSSHTGSHADAPLHYDNQGCTADQMALDPYIGLCQLIDLSTESGDVCAAALKTWLQPGIKRVLLKTYRVAPSAWDSDFRAILPEAIELLAANGVQLIGTDTPSLDPQDSKQLLAHHCVARHRMSILEGLVLADVSAGFYELIALPLKIRADAAPVRAVLRTLEP